MDGFCLLGRAVIESLSVSLSLSLCGGHLQIEES